MPEKSVKRSGLKLPCLSQIIKDFLIPSSESLQLHILMVQLGGGIWVAFPALYWWLCKNNVVPQVVGPVCQADEGSNL